MEICFGNAELLELCHSGGNQ